MTQRPLDPQRWQRLTELFDRALDLDAAGRADLLAGTEDEALRAELQRMLAADSVESPLDTVDAQATRAQVARLLQVADDGGESIGQHIGIWRIDRVLGGGGMGRVFLAVRDDGEFEQRVALKVLRAAPLDDLTRRRFLEERRVLAKLAHPRIAHLLDGGLSTDGEPWYAMEYVDGAPLTTWCDARKLYLDARVALFCKVCEAVDFAHRHLVIHRDLKPGNILVDAEGEPKLLDFGIAKLLPSPDAHARSDTRLMTPEYAAPEQLRNETVSTATDVYALGAILFELLTGRRAFPDPLAPREPPSASRACADTESRNIERAGDRATSPRHLRVALQGDLDRIVRAALEPDPARRYRSAAALATDLRLYLRHRPISLRHDRGYRFAKFVRRHRIGVAASTLATFALLAVSVVALRQAYTARVQARRADAVKDFMVDVFASGDPSQNAGKGPSARELLDAGSRDVQARFRDDPKTAATLSGALASSYAGIGAYDRALPLARRALDSMAALHGDAGGPALRARLDYADILRSAAKFPQALQQAAKVLQATHDDVGKASLRAHLIMARVYNAQHDDAPARAAAERALTMAGAFAPPDMHAQAVAWSEIAEVDLSQGDFKSAQGALRESAALFARSQGGDADETVDARMNLIFVLLHTGHMPEGLSMYADLIARQERAFGANDPKLAGLFSNYAYVLWSAGRYAQGREESKHAQAVTANAHDLPAMRRNSYALNLGILERSRGDLIGALRVLAPVSATGLPTGVDDNRDLFSAAWQRAAIAGERGDVTALAALDRLREQALANHYPLGTARELEWVVVPLSAGQWQPALQRAQALAVATPVAHSHGGHPADLPLHEAIALIELGRYGEAETQLAAVLKLAAGKPGQKLEVVGARLWRGWSQVRQGDARAGLADIEAALAWRSEQLGKDSYLTAEAHLAHAEALAQLGRRTEALQEQALARKVLSVQLLPGNALLSRVEAPLPR